MADSRFLREHLYTGDASRFAGSTHRYLARRSLASDRGIVLDGLRSAFPAECQNDAELKSLTRRFVDKLPDEIGSLVELPSETPLEETVQLAMQCGEAELEVMLAARLPFGWWYANLNRLYRRREGEPPPATASEATALLGNYHIRGSINARARYPDVWDTERGIYQFDSRGIAFAQRFVQEMRQRGYLQHGEKFLDVGSGIATMLFAVNTWSSAHAVGVEKHDGLFRLASTLAMRLERKGVLDGRRFTLARDDIASAVEAVESARLIYLYSPLGPGRIDLDPIVRRMTSDSLLVTERLPADSLDLVRFEPEFEGLFVLRRS